MRFQLFKGYKKDIELNSQNPSTNLSSNGYKIN